MTSLSQWIVFSGALMLLLFCASPAVSSVSLSTCSCEKYDNVKIDSIKRIRTCHEQRESIDCIPAFVIKTVLNRKLCIDPNASWINKHITNNKTKCDPWLSRH